MINGRTVLAVIPARGGSKRAPRKNIRAFRGFPLIEWAWRAARESNYIDRVVLSTDDAEIRKYAAANAVTVIHRPEHLASDTSTNEDVLRHVLGLLDAYWLVLLQPTSPLRIAADIDGCLEIAQTVFPVVSVRANGTKNGAVYIAPVEWLLAGHNFSEEHIPYFMPDERSLDIDYDKDFHYGEGTNDVPAQLEENQNAMVTCAE